MKLFLPSARATNCLLIVGFCSLGYALYHALPGHRAVDGRPRLRRRARHLALRHAPHRHRAVRAIRCSAGRRSSSPLLNLLRPSLVLFAVALALACLGIVLYNVGLSALAVALLILSLARRAPEPD